MPAHGLQIAHRLAALLAARLAALSPAGFTARLPARPTALLASLAACLLLLAGTARAAEGQADDDTLERVARSGRLSLGVQDAAVPLSYLGPDGTHIGYQIDICRRLVAAVQARLPVGKTLQLRYVATTMATRLALLNNGSIDIECAHNPVRPASLSQALFSHATMVSELRLMTTSARAALSLETLGGLRIGQASGGSSVGALRRLAKLRGFSFHEVYARTAPELFRLLVSGKVDAVSFPTPYMLAQRALSDAPAQYRLVDGVLHAEPIALMFRLGDERLQALANETLAAMMLSGEMRSSYERWFTQPIPGLATGLGMPLPARLEGWFREPGSEMADM